LSELIRFILGNEKQRKKDKIYFFVCISIDVVHKNIFYLNIYLRRKIKSNIQLHRSLKNRKCKIRFRELFRQRERKRKGERIKKNKIGKIGIIGLIDAQ
jgi:hypothetical protein